jgi:4-hydroxythreonine-4-phosphate dehydrogenase
MTSKPLVALTLGDASGIGPELVARLVERAEWRDVARAVIVGDRWVWEAGQGVAGVRPTVRLVRDLAQARQGDEGVCAFLEIQTVSQDDVAVGRATAAAGRGALTALNVCLEGVRGGAVDAVCFAPLNKHAMKLGGLKFEDELHHFADFFGVESYFCEFNTLGQLWTSRVSSHVPMKEIFRHITPDRLEAAAQLTWKTLREAGFDSPRIGVAALNPHGGDGGTCGREEVDILAPTLERLRHAGVPVAGPFPADTIFLKARDGLLDAIVTLYHDQGQIAIKLMGFERGVTVQGGLPAPITTPSHGTAFDIAGLGRARPDAMVQAFLLAASMGAAKRVAMERAR